MLRWGGRARIARRVFAVSLPLSLLIPFPAVGGTAVVRDIFVEEFAPAYPDARSSALQRAMKLAVARATAGVARVGGVTAQRAESLVSFVEVLEETVQPNYYALRVSIGVRGPNVQDAEEAPADGPLPVVHSIGHAETGASMPPRTASGRTVPMLLSVKVPYGNPGALAGYRAVLAGLDVQHVRIRPSPDLLLDVTVSVRRPLARLPDSPPGSGILISEEPPED